VRDLEGIVEFYERALGLQVSDRLPYPKDAPFHEAVFLRCNTEHHVMSIFGLRDAPEPPKDPRAPRPGLHHFAFEVATFEDLQRAARYVKEHGIPLQGMRSGGPGSQLRVYFWDPEDNMIELFWAMDHVGWDGATREYPPIEPVDLESFDVDAWLSWKGPEFVPSPAGTRAG
jgi:catechol 2,3-dioxygenase